MKLRIILILVILIIIDCAGYEIMSFDKAIQNINNVTYNKTDYDNMINYIKTLFNKYFVYLDIAKNPPPPLKPVDFIKELDSINTQQITYYEFYQKVYSQILLLQNTQIHIDFERINEFYYFSPVKYILKTKNNKNYLYISNNTIDCNSHYSNEICNKFSQNKDKYIKTINNKNPFDFIEQFGRYQRLKSSHANFIFNYETFCL